MISKQNHKITALELTASLSSGAGGLQAAVSGLTGHLASVGVSAEAWTMRDTDVKDGGPLPGLTRFFDSIPIPGFRLAPGLGRALSKSGCQVLHLHGLWTSTSLAALRWPLERPKIIAPHGMLDAWAILRSSYKKRWARMLFEDRNFQTCVCWHALCYAEYLAIRRLGFIQPVAVVPNGVELPVLGKASSRKTQHTLLYLGRLHPKKNLEILLRAWNGLPGKVRRGWRLRICGWGEASYERHLRSLGTSDVEWRGPVFGREKELIFRDAEAFVLPSLSEGLPMAVLEAWSYRLPVLMSVACNIPEGFAVSAALDSGTTEKSVTGALLCLFGMPKKKREVMGTRGWRLTRDRFTWSAVAQNMAQVYRWTLGLGPLPGCVLTD